MLRSDSVEHEGTDDVPRRFVSQRGDVVMNEGDKKANLCEVASKIVATNFESQNHPSGGLARSGERGGERK